MSQFRPDDSDCILEEPNITCISLDDTQNHSDEEEVHLPPPICDEYLEEGEVVDAANNQKEIICEIKFPNKIQFEQHGPLIINIIKNKFNEQMGTVVEIVEEENQDYVQFTVQKKIENNEETRLTSMMETQVCTEKEHEIFEKETSPDFTGLRELFTIDTTPVPKIDSVKVPSYKRAIKDALLDEEAAATKKKKEEINEFKIRKKNSCFNCGETDHSIRECSKPHNAKRIKNAKKMSFKFERYHTDIEQRFAHIKPGHISDKLREALGLRKGELPFFFYRMRVLGYPTGWLQEAKVEHSGINLFNSDGTKILHSDEEEGEIDVINHKYNISKIYDFPGFNQDPGKNFFDDYKYHNVPPLDKRQMKEEFIKTLGDNVLKGYKRKKLKDFPNAIIDGSINNTVHESTDMDIEDPETSTIGEVQFSRPPPPTDEPPSTPPPPPPASLPLSYESPIDVSECKERGSSNPSPSLMKLEKQKQRLLQELESNTSVIEIEDSLDVPENTEVVEDETIVIKESIMGTPVLKFSPYNNLPNGENFKVGVSDVINFENLPDSTGKYEKIKKVIKKIRYSIHKLHSEE